MNNVHQLTIACGLAIVLAGLIGIESAGSEPAGTKRAVIFAPTHYRQLDDAPFLSHGADSIRDQLSRSGFEESNIVSLGGKECDVSRRATAANLLREVEELANASGADDLFIVIVAAHGLHLNGIDWICPENASASEIAQLTSRPASARSARYLLAVEDIVRKMAISSSPCRLLVLDHAASTSTTGSVAGKHAAGRFGNQPLPILDNQFVICNRSGRLAAGNGSSMTCFMQSVIQGLACHADMNQDQSVSLLELCDYVRNYADAEQYTPPTVQGKMNADFVLGDTTEAFGKQSIGDPQLAGRLFDTALSTACRALLVERNAEASLAAIDRSLHYAITPAQKQMAEGLRLTALAFTHDGAAAWKAAQENGRPLMLLVPAETRVFQNARAERRNVAVGWRGRRTAQRVFDPSAGQLPAGVLVEIAARSGDRFQTGQVLKPIFESGTIRFEHYSKAPRGWIPVATNKSQPTPLPRQLSRLFDNTHSMTEIPR